MEAGLKTFPDLMSSLVEIPKHQRFYSWGQENWQRLWLTILSSYREEYKNESNANNSVFMGAVVRQELDTSKARMPDLKVDKSTSIDRTAIVDGQQRVITISILSAAIRDFYYKEGTTPHYLMSVKVLNLPNNDSLGSNKLRVQDTDRLAFEKAVQIKSNNQDVIDVCNLGHPVTEAYRFFWQALNRTFDAQSFYYGVDDDENDMDLDEVGVEDDTAPLELSVDYSLPKANGREHSEKGLLDPDVLRKIVDSSFKFAVVDLKKDDQDMAFEIFETLNDSGQPLSNVDKFRNGYFMLAPDSADTIHAKYWAPLELKHSVKTNKGISLTSLDQFFHDETIRRFGWVATDKVYQTLIGQIKAKTLFEENESSAENALHSELSNLLESDEVFRFISGMTSNLDQSFAKEVSEEVSFLQRFDSKPTIPVLMQLIKTALQYQASPDMNDELARSLHVVSGFLVRRLLAGVPAQQLRSQIADVPTKLRNWINNTAPTTMREITDEFEEIIRNLGTEKYPNDETLRLSYETAVYSKGLANRQLFAVLWALESTISPEIASMGVPEYGTGGKKWTIEHILPQGKSLPKASKKGPAPIEVTLTEEWEQEWGSLSESERREEFLRLRHTIGNLTLLQGASNSAINSKSFKDKKTEYAQSTVLKITTSVISSESWLPQDIRKRSAKLIEIAVNKWPW